MSNHQKQFLRGRVSVGKIGEVVRILDAKGNDVMTMKGGPERLVECANALTGIWFPENHVTATDDYVKRLETLRKEAWERAQKAEALLAEMGVSA